MKFSNISWEAVFWGGLASRLWLNGWVCLRLRAEFSNQVWSYDFMMDRTYDGQSFRTLNIIPELPMEGLDIAILPGISLFDK